MIAIVEDHLLTVREACERLHVSRPTLELLMSDGELTKLKIRTAVRIRASEVDAYLARAAVGHEDHAA